MRILLISFLFLTGCGYRWHFDYPEGMRPTLCVPFIKEDEDASLTTEIVACLEASGVVKVVPKNADYRLDVKLLGGKFDQIGYRYDPQKINGKVKKNLLAAEGRRSLDVEVTVFRGEEVAYGPYFLSADADYDYVDGDSYQDLTFVSAGKTIEVLPFSLGQLESVESAQEAATRPLFRKIAQKIVDVISAEW